jgi:hypothetical protein
VRETWESGGKGLRKESRSDSKGKLKVHGCAGIGVLQVGWVFKGNSGFEGGPASLRDQDFLCGIKRSREWLSALLRVCGWRACGGWGWGWGSAAGVVTKPASPQVQKHLPFLSDDGASLNFTCRTARPLHTALLLGISLAAHVRFNGL